MSLDLGELGSGSDFVLIVLYFMTLGLRFFRRKVELDCILFCDSVKFISSETF